MSDDADWTGHLDADGPGKIRGRLTDAWGWSVVLSGTRDPAGGYILTAKLDPAPEALRVPLVDDPA